MIVLAIDTALGAAAACLYDTDEKVILAEERLVLSRGHDAVLLPIVQRVVANVGFDRIGRIAVTVGPGSFTGLRIGIAAAQGLGLARGIPVVGVSTLAAFAAPAVESTADSDDLVVAMVDMKHGRVCLEAFGAAGRSLAEPVVLTAAEVLRVLGAKPVRLVGSGAPIVAVECWKKGIRATVVGDTLAPKIDYVARLGSLADPEIATARPLYVKDVDVAIPAGAGG